MTQNVTAGPSRRTVAQGLAWSVPAVAAATAAPAFANSAVYPSGCQAVTSTLDWSRAEAASTAGWLRVPVTFPGIGDVWFQVENMGSFDANRDQMETTLTVSGNQLVVERPAGRDYSGFRIVPEGEFAYDPRFSLNGGSMIIRDIDRMEAVAPEDPYNGEGSGTILEGDLQWDSVVLGSDGSYQDVYYATGGTPGAVKLSWNAGGPASSLSETWVESINVAFLNDDFSDPSITVDPVQITLWMDPNNVDACGDDGTKPYRAR